MKGGEAHPSYLKLIYEKGDYRIMFEPTNTLASANFDILKMDAVEDPLINVNKLATLDFEESYTAQVVAFINETRSEMTDKKITFYKSLNEATSERAVLESFADFFAGVRDIIAKFIKFIKKLVDKFVASVMKIVKSDKYIKKHKDLFKHIESDMEFDFQGYEYIFSPMIPSPDAALGYNNSLFDDLYSNEKRQLTAQSVKDSIVAMDLEKDYDEFRAKVIGKENDVIYISDFSRELYEVYRNGESDTSTITADTGYIRKCLNRYLEYDRMQKEVTHQRDAIIKAYEKVQKQVEDITKRNTDLDKQAFLSRLPVDNGITDIETTAGGTMMAAELMTQIDVYTRAKVDQIQEYSNIHLLAFGAKLDAMKECLNQDRNVLYTALQKSNVPFEKKGGKK
jgi:hypothetical protein